MGLQHNKHLNLVLLRCVEAPLFDSILCCHVSAWDTRISFHIVDNHVTCLILCCATWYVGSNWFAQPLILSSGSHHMPLLWWNSADLTFWCILMNCICMSCCIPSWSWYGIPFVSTYAAIPATELCICEGYSMQVCCALLRYIYMLL